MARGDHNTPPNKRSLVITRSRSDTNIILETTTTSNDTPGIPVEPVTPLPQGINVQEIVRQSLIRTQSVLSHIRQPGRQLNQPFDFTNLQDQLQGTGLPRNTIGTDNITNHVEAFILSAGGSGIPPSPPGSSPPSLGGESLDEDMYSSEPSQPSTPPTPMAKQNNPVRPWLDQDVVAVLGPQHPFPKHPEKWLPKFDLDSKQSVEDHMKKFILAIRLWSVEHEDVMCRLFPYTFEGNASSWYFAQQPQTIVSWDKFETCFLEKFGDDKFLEVLEMEISSLKMNPKEKIKDFNQRFLTLKNKILVDLMPAENLIVAYYTKALHNNIAIWVKRSKKNTLLKSFEEASQIERHIEPKR
jgi:hypothetical protein